MKYKKNWIRLINKIKNKKINNILKDYKVFHLINKAINSSYNQKKNKYKIKA